MSLMRFLVLAGLTVTLWLCSCSGEEEPTTSDQAASEPESPAPTAAEDASNETPAGDTAGTASDAPVKAAPEPQASEALRRTLAALPTEARSVENPFAGRAELLSKGKDDFLSLCAQCHGNQGKGDGPAAKRAGINPADLTASKLTVGERFEVIKNGVTGTLMPPFGAAISSRQIWSLISFMESLRPAPPAAQDAPSDSP